MLPHTTRQLPQRSDPLTVVFGQIVTFVLRRRASQQNWKTLDPVPVLEALGHLVNRHEMLKTDDVHVWNCSS